MAKRLKKKDMRHDLEYQLEMPRNGIQLQELTLREMQVLRLIAEGYTSGEIGMMLKVVPETVYSHRKSMMEKFGARNVAHLVACAFRKKLIK